MSSIQHKFIEFCIESKVLRFGEFKTKAGRLSPYFFNAGLFNTGAMLSKLADFYARTLIKAMEEGRIECDMIFGPAYKGITLAAAVAMRMAELGYDLPFAYNRKEVKDHGDTGILLGSKIKDGDKVVIIEDVTTSGKSMEETVPKVRGAANVEIVGLMVSLNRMEMGLGGKMSALDEIRETYGFPTNAIVTMEEVVEHLYNKECQGKIVINDEIKKAIDAYYEQYGCK